MKNYMSHACGIDNVLYSKEFDSYYCTSCDSWIEGGCSDADCSYCKERPLRPSDFYKAT